MLGRRLTFEDTIKNPNIFLITITNIIPIILHFDEFQKKIPLNRENIAPEDQLYYQLSSFFSGILNLPIFILLSGTKYTIINTIGDNLGSPLNGKVDPIIIPFLKEEDLEIYADRIFIQVTTKEEIMIKNCYLKWLKYMSFGHPRTMEYMTVQFIKYFNDFLTSEFEGWIEEDLETVFNEINNLVETSLQNTHLRSNPIKKLHKLIANSPPSIVNILFTYINERLIKGMYLGQLESDISAEFIIGKKDDDEKNQEQEVKKEQLKNILSQLVEVGFFSRNGHNNFYMSSMYALKYFTQKFHEWIPLLSKAFEKLLSNSGLFSFIQSNAAIMGSFWEEVFSAVLSDYQIQSDSNIPEDIVDCYGNLSYPKINKKIEIEYIKKRPVVNTPYLKKLKPYHLYITPLIQGIDGILLYDETVFLIQIKRSPDSNYVEKGLTAVLQAAKRLQRSNFTIVPWLIDVLGGLNPKRLENKNILYTTKNHLIEFLPESLK